MGVHVLPCFFVHLNYRDNTPDCIVVGIYRQKYCVVSVLTCIPKQDILLAQCTYVMSNSLTAWTNHVLIFSYPTQLDVKTSEVCVDIILVLFPAPLEWRQTVKSSDEQGLGDLFCYCKFGEENEFDCCDLCEMPFRPLKQNFDLTHYWSM